MALPADDSHGSPGAVGDGAATPVPTHPADVAEHEARLAVEGVGVGVTPRQQAQSWRRIAAEAAVLITIVVAIFGTCALLGWVRIGQYP